MLCLLTRNDALEKELRKLTKSLHISLIKAETTQEAQKHFSTRLCKGLIVDQDWPNRENLEVSSWATIHFPESEFLIVIEKSLSSDDLKIELLKYVAQRTWDYTIPATLVEDYSRSIPAKLQTLKNLLMQVKQACTEDALQALRREVHKIAGNAGTYGYLSVSIYAKEWEAELVEQLKATDQKDGSLKIHAMEDYLNKIEKGFFEDRPDD